MCGPVELAIIMVATFMCPSKWNKAVRDGAGAIKVKSQHRYREWKDKNQ